MCKVLCLAFVMDSKYEASENQDASFWQELYNQLHTNLLNIICIIFAKLIDTFLKSRQKNADFGELMEIILRQQYGLAS